MKSKILALRDKFLYKKVKLSGIAKHIFEKHIVEGVDLMVVGITNDGQLIVDGFRVDYSFQDNYIAYGKGTGSHGCVGIYPHHVSIPFSKPENTCVREPNSLFSYDEL